jgi:hypothetical protein
MILSELTKSRLKRPPAYGRHNYGIDAVRAVIQAERIDGNR